MRNPCYQCQDRQIGCHANCEKYLEMRQEIDKKKKDRETAQDTEAKIRRVMKGGRRK